MISKGVFFLISCILVICTIQACFDSGAGAGGNPNIADTTVSLRSTNWLLEEFVLNEVFVVDRTNALSQNIILEFQGEIVTVGGLLNDCTANFKSDGLTKMIFSNLSDCTTNCCDTDQFVQFKSLLVEIKSFQISNDRKVVFFKKDLANYFKLKRTN